MGTRSTGKSSPKSSGAFVPGDPRIRRGRGPKKGAPNAGRPPDKIRETARSEVDRGVSAIAAFMHDDNVSPDTRIRAFLALLKTSGMERLEHTGADGAAIPAPITIFEAKPA